MSPLHTAAPQISAITSPEEISKTGGLSHHQTPHIKTGSFLPVLALILTERLDLWKAVINILTGKQADASITATVHCTVLTAIPVSIGNNRKRLYLFDKAFFSFVISDDLKDAYPALF